jgi:uroporphyrinogen-III synthase
MNALDGRRVAVLEARRGGELASLVGRFRGVPYHVPAVREVPQLEQVPAFLDRLCAGAYTMVICQTGAGIARLLDEAQRLGRLDAARTALRGLTTVCRGPKPAVVLRQHEIPVVIRAAEPHTTVELLEALAPVELAGRPVAVLHYGERNEPLTAALASRGAVVDEICIYEWKPPEDMGPLETLVREVIDGRIDALAFTSQIQARHLFDAADSMGASAALTDALNRRVIVAAIGPVCVSTLRARGVTPHVVPQQGKMGLLVTALADHFGRGA